MFRWVARMGLLAWVVTFAVGWLAAQTGAANPVAGPLSPEMIAASADGKTLFVTAATGNQVMVVSDGKLAACIALPDSPTGIAATGDGQRLFVTLAPPTNTVAVIDVGARKIAAQFPAGAGACAPVLSPKGDRLFVASRFIHAVTVLDAQTGKPVGSIPAVREPVAMGLTGDGAKLVVANLLPAGAANAEVVAAAVNVIDVASGKSVAIALPNGSASLRGVAMSPDNRVAAVTHILARFNLPTTQLERGWMSTNAVSFIDVQAGKLINTVLLDDVDSGAANPWGVAYTGDGKSIVVAHAGTHELSIIDATKVMEKIAKAPTAADVPNDLSFLVDLRKRVKVAGNGPRGLVMAGGKAYAPCYFSDDVAVLDLATGSAAAIALGAAKPQETIHRKGERLFFDATICFQSWQSCGSCHPDARVDGLNWDLLNDGIGNPKNTKNMLLSHKTPPAMSMGVRDTAETAVRAGIRHILFAVRPEEEAVAMDEYLKSLKPVPSPLLVKGNLSEAAQRGQKIFADPAVGCANCHSGPYFTDLKHHDVATSSKFDKPNSAFDTPALIEAWRTGPYLHDGAAATMRDVLTTQNKQDRHGKTSHLSKPQLDDLVEYLMSL